MVMEFLRPDTYVIEQPGQPRVQGVGVSAAGFLIEAEWGPDDEPTLSTTFAEVQRRYGGFYGGLYGLKANHFFFRSGGSRSYNVRVTDATAAKASGSVNDLNAVGATSLAITAKYKGVLGNRLRLDTEKSRTTIATAVVNTTNAGALDVASAAGLEIGDLILIGNPEDGDQNTTRGFADAAFITQINRGGGTGGSDRIGVTDFTISGGDLTVGTRLSTSTTHRFRASLAVTPASTAQQLTLNSAGAAKVGQLVVVCRSSISTGARTHVTTISAVNGNVITLTDALPGGIAFVAGDIIASLEFDLGVILDDVLIEPRHTYLSMETGNATDYVNTRLSGTGNQSQYVDVVKGATAAPGEEQLPLPLAQLALTGGLNNAATPLTDPTLYTAALLQFSNDFAEEVMWIAAPGKSIAIQQTVIDYCEISKPTSSALIDPESTDDSQDELIDLRDVRLNRDSSYAMLLAPWVLVDDPETGTRIPFPPSGIFAGEQARTAKEFGIHHSPANRALPVVRGLVFDVTDSQHDVLNIRGVNMIRNRPGEGIRIMGSRTLQTIEDGRHFIAVRNLFNFIKRALLRSNRAFLFKPMNDALFGQVFRANEAFLRALWKSGALVPSGNKSEALYVKVDPETTSGADRAGGVLNIDIGIQSAKPTEKLIFRISELEGNASISEIVG